MDGTADHASIVGASVNDPFRTSSLYIPPSPAVYFFKKDSELIGADLLASLTEIDLQFRCLHTAETQAT
jgi:hypothetical protein